MLKDILEAEKKAREEATENKKYKAERMASIEEEKNQIISRRVQQAHDDAERIRSGHRQSVAESMQSIEQSCKESKTKFKILESNDADMWIQELYERVIGNYTMTQ